MSNYAFRGFTDSQSFHWALGVWYYTSLTWVNFPSFFFWTKDLILFFLCGMQASDLAFYDVWDCSTDLLIPSRGIECHCDSCCRPLSFDWISEPIASSLDCCTASDSSKQLMISDLFRYFPASAFDFRLIPSRAGFRASTCSPVLKKDISTTNTYIDFHPMRWPVLLPYCAKVSYDC